MFIISEIYQYSISVAKDTHLAITLKDGDTGEVIVENTGNYDIEITNITLEDYEANCLYFTVPNIEDLDTYLQEQTKKAINTDNLLRITELESLVISKGEKVIRNIFSKPTSQGTFCAFDIPIIIHYSSTSFWADLYLTFLKKLDLLDPKHYMYIRFDGCKYVQIGKNTYLNRAKYTDQIHSKLSECLKKYPKLNNKKKMIELNAQKYRKSLQNVLVDLSNHELIEASKFITEKVKSETSGSKANYCYKYMFIYEELKTRSLINENTNNSYTDILNNCMSSKSNNTPEPIKNPRAAF